MPAPVVLGSREVARLFGGQTSSSGLPVARRGRYAGSGFGDAQGRGGAADGFRAQVVGAKGTVNFIDCPTQEAALKLIASIIEQDAMQPELQGLARAICARVPARNDWAELQEIYKACKTGRADLERYGLKNGVRYMSDARTGPDGSATDVFFTPSRLLEMLKRGENGFDCDDCTMFVGALVKNCGFRAGARAYGEGQASGFEHVYPVALYPKHGPWHTDTTGRPDESHLVGLDITVPQARAGWQPPHGDVFTALLD